MLAQRKQPDWKSIRGGMGLGDALYVQGVARYFIERGQRLEVCNKWPDVFSQHGDMVRMSEFRRERIDILSHYSVRKRIDTTNQWQDCCISAGIREPWELKIDWVPSSHLITGGKPYVCVALPRTPMDRKDGIGASLLPDCRVIQRCIDVLKQKYRIVQIGAGEGLYDFKGIDIDLANKTTVAELLDVASGASGFLGHVSFIVPLAESFSKPGLFIWSHKGLRDSYPYVRQITPRKILSKDSSKWIMDNAPGADIDAIAALL